MNQPGILQYGHRVQQLRHEHFDELCAEALELVLLDELIQIRRQQFEYKAQMTSMDEGIA